MQPQTYEMVKKMEAGHWWFVARRNIMKSMIENMNLVKPATIIELGCGTGCNFEMLSQFGSIYGSEIDDESRKVASSRGFAQEVDNARLPQLPFPDKKFDLVIMADVLEHVKEDGLVLEKLHGCLNNGGKLLITVPAFKFLWSNHDVTALHHRRYIKGGLGDLLKKTGYKVNYISYFNMWLFPIIALVRIIKNTLKMKDESDFSMPSPAINKILTGIFSSEKFFLGKKITLPFGVSLVALAEH